MTAAAPHVSIVVPVYRCPDALAPLHERLVRTLEPLTDEWEILFVEDACPLGSRVVLERLAAVDPRVSALVLAENVGQHRAVMAGLAAARGEWVVVMDGDLQDPPEAIPFLLAAGAGASAVFAGRRGAYESRGRLLTSRLFKTLLHRLAGVPADAGMFVALRRGLVEELLAFPTSRPYLVSMIGCTGRPSVSIPVERSPRAGGSSAYSSAARLRTGVRAIVLVLAHRLAAGGNRRPPAEPKVALRLGSRFAAGECR